MRACISLTFDDGLPCQLEHAIPMLDRAGMPATFFLPTRADEYPVDFGAWLRATDGKHEVGSHSVNHHKAGRLTGYAAEMEARKSKITLQHELGVPIESFCYPYTDAPRHLQRAVKNHYRQARGGRLARENKLITPGDGVNFLNVPCFHINETVLRDDEIYRQLRTARELGAWIVLMFHGIGEQGTWDNVQVPTFDSLLQVLRCVDRDMDVVTFKDGAERVRRSTV